MTVTDFVSLYPAFVRVDETLIAGKLVEAAKQIHAETWGDQADEGLGLLTAHKLATDPTGQNARLQSEMESTTYGKRYMELREQVAFGLGRAI